MPLIHPPALNACIRDAYKLREEVSRRLLLNACERIRLERIINRLDAEFAGESFIEPIDPFDDHHKEHSDE